jgi:hypothetical protein
MSFAKTVFIVLLSTILFGCLSSIPVRKETTLPDSDEKSSSVTTLSLGQIEFSVQVGAFSIHENARRLEESLRARGFDAYYFRHESGLFKVRFGDYSTHNEAFEEAAKLQQLGKIGDFIIVPPGSITYGIRQSLVETAARFLGTPYSRGGESADEGFDCSGLTVAVYRLNGLKLPRQSARQFRFGQHVGRQDLKKGDLVFFATDTGRKVSHVGVYIGDGKFIHAPRPGKTVRIANLDSGYFKQRYMGGRSYL